MNKIKIDTDKSKLDIDFIHAFISKAYWAKDRTVEEMQTCIDNSFNFGVYLNNSQIGYARVVTDYSQFAYLLDVFIDEKHRGNGFSKDLMNFIMCSKILKNIKTWRLATSDAHLLYQQFGFTALSKPENMMENLTNSQP